MNIVHHIKEKIKNILWEPGEFLTFIIIIIFMLIDLWLGGYWGI